MPTPPKKLTLQDAQEALMRVARATGPTPTKITLDPKATAMGAQQYNVFRGFALGDYPMPGEDPTTGPAAVGQNLLEQGRTKFGQLQADLAKRLLGPEIPEDERYYTPPTLKPFQNLYDIATHPTSIGGGIYEAGKAILGGLKDNAIHGYRAVVPSATDELLQTPRLENLAKAVPMVGGLVEPLKKEYTAALAETPYVEGDRFPAAKFRAALTAATRVGLEAFGTDIGIALSGQIQDPETGKIREATPTEKMKSGVLAGLLLKGGREVLARSGRPNIITSMEGDLVSPLLKAKAQTSGEMAATKLVSDLAKAQRKESMPQPVPVEAVVDAAGQTRPESLAATTPVTATSPSPKSKSSYSYPSIADAEFQKLYEESDTFIKESFSQPAALTAPALKDYVADVLMDPIKSKAARTLVEEGSPVSAAIFETVADPRFKMNVPRVMEERGLTPEQAQKLVAGSMENTGHFSGQDLNVFSQALDELEASLTPPPKTAPLSEMLRYQAQVKEFEWWKNNARLPEWAKALQASGKVQSVTRLSQNAERLRISMMLSELPTTVHIMKSQAITSIGDIFDAFNTGLVSGAMRPTKMFTSENWADLIGHGVALGESIRPGGRAMTNELLAQNPMIAKRLLTGLMGEADNTAGFFAANARRVFKDVSDAEWGTKGAAFKADWQQLREAGHFNSLPGTILYDVPMAASDILTIGLRAQEVAFRKFAFRARLEGNLRKLGVSTDELMPMLKKAQVLDKEGKAVELAKSDDGTLQIPEGLQIADVDSSISPAIREALVDAEIHALRSTWAATPEGWLGQSLQAAKMWNSVSPLQTSQFFTPFVRAMANNVMWQMHHNPANLADLLLPEYRKAFGAVGENGMTLRQSRDIQRSMGEALTGMAMLTASLHMASGGQAGGYSMGPKPWIWTTGADEQGDQQTYDVRQYPQLAESSALAAMIHAKLRGEANPIGFLEAAEIFGNTRVGTVPIFNVLQEIRNAASANDEVAWDATWRELGALVAPFGNIPETLRKDYGRIALEAGELATSGEVTGDRSFSADYTLPDTSRQAPVGPIVGKTAPEMLPPRVSPFTGVEMQDPSKIKDLTVGAAKEMTPMEWLLTKTPGLTPSAITKIYRNPEAQQMVNRATGEILNGREFLIGEYSPQEYAKILNRMNQPELSKFYMDLFLPAIRQLAETKAMVGDMQRNGTTIPPHFIDEQVAKLPTGGIPNFKTYWEELLKAQLQSQRPPTQPTRTSIPR